MKRLLSMLAALAAGMFSQVARAAEPVTPCISHDTQQSGHVHIVKVDLRCPSISLVGTPQNQAGGTVKNFAYKNKLNVAINASFFDAHYRPQGLVVTAGRRWVDSRDSRQHTFLACTQDNRCSIDPPNNLATPRRDWETVVAGWQNLRNGRYLCGRGASRVCHTNARSRHPRTSLGLSPDRRWLYIIVVEGRLQAFSGYTLNQLARLYQSLGVQEAMNLDGGGSTTLVINNRRINALPANQFFLERNVANQLGVRDSAAR